jgi:hypothetical protein
MTAALSIAGDIHSLLTPTSGWGNGAIDDPDAATGNPVMATIDIVMYIGITQHRAGLIFPVFFLKG